MTNQRIKFIASPNLLSLERDVNNWLKEELNINIRQMSLYTDIGDDYEMALMIWYDIADAYTEKKKQQKTSKNDATEKGLEKLAKISSARVQLPCCNEVCFITAFETYYEKFKQEFLPLEEIKGFIRKPIQNRRLDTIYEPSHKVVWL